MSEPIRETPALPPLLHGSTSCHQSRPDEPVLEIEEIQGNILAGFNKDFQTHLFLRIRRDQVGDFKGWLKALVPSVATTAEVLAFNRLFKAIRKRRKSEGRTLQATWLNVALSFQAVELLAPADASRFRDEAFRQGMWQRSADLGDPRDPEVEGHYTHWVVGGEENDADVILIVASDSQDDLLAEVARIETSIYASRAPDGRKVRSGADIIYKQHGATLPAPLTGHEHFGFQDGISQPGIRGRLSSDPSDVLMLRQNPADADQGKPGQDLLWPGEFVFGYKGQDRQRVITEPSAADVTEGPPWSRNGSFLVFRRLRQDVPGFNAFLNNTASQLKVDPALLGAKCVGRWKSGTPILRAPQQDDPKLAADDCANNHFEFRENPPAPAPSEPGYGGGSAPSPPATAAASAAPASQPAVTSTPGDVPGASPDDGVTGAIDREGAEDGCLCPPDSFPDSRDPDGLICPFAAHIRKAYPRNDMSASGLNESDTQTHRLLRRGIPFGDPFRGEMPYAADSGDRGLLFLAYQTSLVDQFEFVTKRWVNNPDFKEPSQGGQVVSGFDPILGQTSSDDGKRPFRVTFQNPDGSTRSEVVTADQNWVVPTGGGYFFAPSISALSILAGGTADDGAEP